MFLVKDGKVKPVFTIFHEIIPNEVNYEAEIERKKIFPKKQSQPSVNHKY